MKRLLGPQALVSDRPFKRHKTQEDHDVMSYINEVHKISCQLSFEHLDALCELGREVETLRQTIDNNKAIIKTIVEKNIALYDEIKYLRTEIANGKVYMEDLHTKIIDLSSLYGIPISSVLPSSDLSYIG